MKTRLTLMTLLAFSFGVLSSPAHAATRPARPAVVAPAAPQGPNVNMVTCESNNGRRTYCSIGDARQSVDLVRQMSSSPCVRGQSWGNDNRGIWVDRGCRAQFRVTSYNGGPSWWNSGPGRPGGRPHDGACFFTTANFSGDYFCQARGSLLNVPNGFNDKISSIQVYGRVTVTIFNDANYQGLSAVTRQSIPDLRAWRVQGYSNKDWNNRISSVRLN
jgi:Protein of unknown function (DUF3011)/Beta/Gamma crystallin